MREKSTFSSKKISTNIKKRSKTRTTSSTQKSQIKKTEIFFDNQEVKKDLQSFYDKEAKKYAETRKKFWHEEKIILDSITPLFEKNKKVRILEF